MIVEVGLLELCLHFEDLAVVPHLEETASFVKVLEVLNGTVWLQTGEVVAVTDKLTIDVNHFLHINNHIVFLLQLIAVDIQANLFFFYDIVHGEAVAEK